MKPFQFLLRFLYLVQGLGGLSLSAQNITPSSFSRPELGSALPWIERDGIIHFGVPILINTSTIVVPEAILRVVYPQPVYRAQHGLPSFPRAFPPGGPNNRSLDGGGRPDGIPPGPPPGLVPPAGINSEKIVEKLQAIQWSKTELFVEALNAIAEQNPHLLYQTEPTGPIKDESIDPPVGLLVGETIRGLEILAVVSEGNGDKAGAKVGDLLVAIEEEPLNHSLERWRDLAPDVLKRSQAENRPWHVRVQRSSKKNQVNLTLKPVSALGGVLDLPVQ